MTIPFKILDLASDPDGSHHHHPHQEQHHEHYVENHGAHPDWLQNNNKSNLNRDVESNIDLNNTQRQGCCRKKKEPDSEFRLQEIKLPAWVVFIAKVNLIWEIILYIMTVATFGVVTFSAFFAFYEKNLYEFSFAMDFIFNCDILLRLFIEIWRYRNQLEVVIFTVPYSMFAFLLDLLTIVPFHQLYIWAVGSDPLSNLSFIDYWRFNRLVRLYRSYIFFKTLQEERRANERLLFFLRFTNLYIGFIHLTSCLLMYLVGVEPLDFMLKRSREKIDETWMRQVNQKKWGYPTEEPLQTYAIATHLATATVTTVGYGDLSATNELEMAWCIFFMLFGAIFLNGYYTSQLTTFELETDGARFDLFFRVNEITKYLKSLGTLSLFDAKVVEYYKCLWTYREGVYDVQFMQRLPPSFQEDLLYDICQELFDKSFLFRGMDEALLRAVAKIVKVALYNPEMILCRKGGYANKLYYILQGECRVMSKFASKPAAILRTGSIIGEANLFFSYPYTTTIETRTCCQFIILEKEDLIMALDDFREQLYILRAKSQAKVVSLYETYQVLGVRPVVWVAIKTDLENPNQPSSSTIRKTMRWGSGINRKVTKDVIDDTKDIVIFDTPCDRKDIMKNHLTPYITCAVPEIMSTFFSWIKYWNGSIMVIAMIHAFIGPYCLSFGENSEFEANMCHFLALLEYPLTIIYILDVFVEIIAAAPVYGLYYQLYDGIKVKRHEATFYIDILAALPIGLWFKTLQSPPKIADTVFKSMKLWKVIRYLRFLDNLYPLRLFWFRLSQTFIVLVYGIHFIACISFTLACYDDPSGDGTGTTCEKETWLHSYQKAFEFNDRKKAPRWMQMETLRDNFPYMISVFYSSATLSSAGFGDFNPQTMNEMWWAIFFQLIGFYIIGYYTSTLTSALSCVVRPKLLFQQKLIYIRKFMHDNNLTEGLKDRIVEYCHLQIQLRGGVTLGEGVYHMMQDTPEYLKNDVMYLEVVENIEGIPIFAKVDPDVIIKMSSFMKRFLVPPNTTFLHKGEIRRVMYLIKQGSIGIYDNENGEPISILEASSHFGIRDLLFGEPCHFTLKTLSHVCMYSIKLHQVQEAMVQDDEFWEFVDKERIKIADSLEEMVKIYSKLVKINQKSSDLTLLIPSWVILPPRPNVKLIPTSSTGGKSCPPYKKNVKEHLENDEYDDLFRYIKFGKCIKPFLMRRTVHPVGLFSGFWASIMSVISFLTLISMCIETFAGFRRPGFRICQWIFDAFFIIDIYVKMHWGYYVRNKSGATILITHPLKTCLNYMLHGTFVLDTLACTPIELLFPLLGWTNFWGYGESATWYTKMRWTRILHIKRLPLVFEIAHTIFQKRDFILLILYVSTTLFVCTLIAAIALYTACPWGVSSWQPGDEYRMPICLESNPAEQSPDYWATIKFGDAELLASAYDRWIIGLYYVSQTVLVIGFGDLITLHTADILILIFMQVFGFIFMRCVIADITAAEVDSDEIRSTFVSKLQTIKLVMERQNVPLKLKNSVMDHVSHFWSRSKGLQPHDLFGDLHPALESDLFSELVGNDLVNVALFRGLTANVLRSMSGFLRKAYFRRGDRIMRSGNLEHSLRIVTSGKVYICDDNFNYMCTLSSGDCFGEASMMQKGRSRYNAIAMTSNVEIYSLSAGNFEVLIERYANLKDQLEERLMGGERDYFVQGLLEKIKLVPKMSERQQIGLIKSFSVRRTKIIQALASREDLALYKETKIPWYHISKWIGYGPNDENLPFIYFAKGHSRKSKRRNFSLLVHPNCTLMQIFNTFLILMSYITPAIATYETAFIGGTGVHKELDFVSTKLLNFSNSIEFLYLISLLLKFISPFKVEEDVYCKTHRGIILHYIFTPTGFLIDALGCVPFVVESLTVERLQTTQWRYVYYFKILRLVRFYKYQFSRKDNLSVSTFRYKMTISVSSFCLMAHMLACFFYIISPCLPLKDKSDLCPRKKDGSDTWTVVFKETYQMKDEDEDFLEWKWWIRSLYFIVAVVSTTGFGDIVPYTVMEMGVAILCIFSGAFILSVILSNFTVGMASLTRANREYIYQVSLLVKHLRNIGLSKTRQDQVMMYFLMLWDRCKGTSYNKATQILPICMQIEVCNSLFAPCLRTVPYFRGHDSESFLRALSAHVIHSIFIPGICIVKEGDQGSSMFVVFKGLVAATKLPEQEHYVCEIKPNSIGTSNDILSNKKSLSRFSLLPDFVGVYKPGDVFGRFPALFQDESYKKSYRAESRVEVLEITQENIIFLSERFPFFRRNMQHLIESRYEADGGAENIFAEKQKRDNLFDLGEEFKGPEEHSKHIGTHGKKKKDEPHPHHPHPQHHVNQHKGSLVSLGMTSQRRQSVLAELLTGGTSAGAYKLYKNKKNNQRSSKDSKKGSADAAANARARAAQYVREKHYGPINPDDSLLAINKGHGHKSHEKSHANHGHPEENDEGVDLLHASSKVKGAHPSKDKKLPHSSQGSSTQPLTPKKTRVVAPATKSQESDQNKLLPTKSPKAKAVVKPPEIHKGME